MTPAEPVAAVPTDAALIATWRGGDEPAAAELVRRHARALARFLAGAGALAADVDDLVQETFIRAFRALGRFRGQDRKSTRLNSSHLVISYAVFCLKKKKNKKIKNNIAITTKHDRRDTYLTVA